MKAAFLVTSFFVESGWEERNSPDSANAVAESGEFETRCREIDSMTLLKVGYALYVCADEIVLLQSFPSRPSRRDKQAAESAGLYKDGTSSGKRRDPLKTLVHLRCGLVVGSPITIDALAHRSPISAPIKSGSRRNNLEGAQILAPGAAPNPAIETTPPAPHIPPRGTDPKQGRSESGREEREAPAPTASPTDEMRSPRARGLRRLMRRD